MSQIFPNLVPFPDAGKDRFNELLFVKKFLKSEQPIRTQGDNWHAYNTKAWELRPRDSFRRVAYEILPERLRKVQYSESILKAVEWSRSMNASEKFFGAVKFDKDRNWILLNCANGVLRISADVVELLPHKEEYMFTGALAAEWHVEAECELFKRVMGEALPDSEDRALLQWFSGYLFYPEAREHEVFLLCYGGGGTGKSTLAEAIIEVIGHEPLVTALSMSQICAEGQGAYSLPSLQTAMVNLGTELDTVELGDSANFKRIVSGETIEARTIYAKPFSMRTTAKLWFNSNTLPRFKHGTEAELRRSRFLWFDQVPKEKDVTLKERMKADRDGILRWMVEGLQAIQGGLPAPMGGEKSARVKEKFAVSNDLVKACIKNLCVLEEHVETKKDELMAAFNEYLDSYGHGQKSKEFLFKTMWDRYPQLKNHRYYAGNELGRLEGYYVRGLRLQTEDHPLCWKPDPAVVAGVEAALSVNEEGIGHE